MNARLVPVDLEVFRNKNASWSRYEAIPYQFHELPKVLWQDTALPRRPRAPRTSRAINPLRFLIVASSHFLILFCAALLGGDILL